MRTGSTTKTLGAVVASLWMASAAQGETLHLRTGFDYLTRTQSTITSLNYASVMKDLGQGVFVGQSVYSAATGDGGGLFIGGFEAFKRFQLSARSSVDVGAFIGGGGGAVQVLGDGLMTKAHVTFNRALGERFAASLGIGWTRVTGSAIDTPIVSFGLSGNLDFALAEGHVAPAPARGVVLNSVKALLRYSVPSSSPRRDAPGLVQPMVLAGGEFTFAGEGSTNREVFLRLSGAAAGDGAGYAEGVFGLRWFTGPMLGGRLRGFADVGAGFSGGGNVDTGGGAIVAASGGLDLRLGRGFHAEAGVSAIKAAGGNFQAVGGFLRTALRFDDPKANASGVDGGPARHWTLSTGLSYQGDHPGLRPSGHPFSGSPMLVETSLDLFLGERLYLTGSAQTAIDGMAAGFAMGTVGLGYEMPLGPRWALSGEVFAGAAAGGGINTGGGLIGGGKLEIDYILNDRLRLSAGVGKWVSLAGARPTTLHLGIKLPLTSFHRN